jgi:hypothetical protein
MQPLAPYRGVTAARHSDTCSKMLQRSALSLRDPIAYGRDPAAGWWWSGHKRVQQNAAVVIQYLKNRAIRKIASGWR